MILGHVIQAGAGQIDRAPGRGQGRHPDVGARADREQGVPVGLNAIALADQEITLGRSDVVVAGGMESMTNGPHLLPGSRPGSGTGR